MKLLTTLLVGGLLAVSANAQRLAATTQTSFFPGGNVVLRVYDTTGNGFLLDSPCGDVDIHFDSPNGVLLPNPPSCGPGQTIIPPFGTFTYTWPPIDPAGNPWQPGDYWFRFRATDPVTMQPFEELFSVRTDTSGAINYVQLDPQVGTSYEINLYGGPPNGFYWIYIARTSNQPLFYQGVQWSLSYDGLFRASLMNPLTVMSGSFGLLDANGEARDANGDLIADLIVPPIAQLAYSGFVMQSLLIDTAGTGAYSSSNPIYRRILP